LIAREACLPDPSISDRLIELETGMFTGRSWYEIKEKDPEAWDRFHHESWEGVEGAEKSSMLYERAMSTWELLRDAECTGTPANVRRIIAVSHAGFLQWLFRTTFGTQTWFPLVSCGNCRIYCLKAERMPSGALTTTWTAMNDNAEKLSAPRN
jgi:broad specificity phosphatase PhoE